MPHVNKHPEGAAFPLAEQKCTACVGGMPTLSAAEITAMRNALGTDWTVVDGHHLSRRYDFRNFAEALDFANRVGALADVEGHHPDITVGWGKAEIKLFTHAVGGLTKNDFILAAKISELLP